MDSYAQNWEETWNPTDQQIVVGGMDLVALAPFIPAQIVPPNPFTSIVSAVLTVVGNAPIPTSGSDYVQLSRDGVDAILNYAQHIAMFKMGGTNFTETLPLFMQFEAYCASQNRRYAALGMYREELLQEGNRDADLDPRSRKGKEDAHNLNER